MMKKISIIAISVILLISCNYLNKNTIYGVYVAEGQLNNRDTLEIFKNGHYLQKLFRKKNNSLIYVNKGAWHYSNDRITLDNYLPDEDDPYPVQYDFSNVLITTSLEIKRVQRKIIIYHRINNEKSYYEKKY